MELHFNPGFKTKPAVHVGSQTLPFFSGVPKEQAWEGFHLAGASEGDVVVVRDIDPEYIHYWRSLMGDVHVVNILDSNKGDFLTKIILERPEIINRIKNEMNAGSRLMVFLPTSLEQELAKRLNVSLHGSPHVSSKYGTKSGIRMLAQEARIPMAQGFICTTYTEVKKTIKALESQFDEIVIKHDLSLSGLFSKRLKVRGIRDRVKEFLDEVCGGKFHEGKDVVVIEGWLKSKASLCAHIEIVEGKDPEVCAAWEQLIDNDGITYIGGGPLNLSEKAMNSFSAELIKLATILKQKGAVGSFGPDFLVAADNELSVEPDTCVLIELNARVPYTAFPLEAIKQVKGPIGNGFYAQHINVKPGTSFSDIEQALQEEKLLITRKDKQAKGVIPYNVGLLPWNLFDIASVANSWDEAKYIAEKVKNKFEKNKMSSV